jgi:hypothetical protein
MSNPRHPIIIDLPKKMAEGEGNEAGMMIQAIPAPQPESCIWESGSPMGLTSQRTSSKRGTPRQGVTRAPKAAQNLRHEQRRNRNQLPKGSGGGYPMLEPGQRGRSSRGSDAPPGSRVTPWQGEGPQPIHSDDSEARLALGRYHVPHEFWEYSQE